MTLRTVIVWNSDLTKSQRTLNPDDMPDTYIQYMNITWSNTDLQTAGTTSPRVNVSSIFIK